jgi:hypothetical protein
LIFVISRIVGNDRLCVVRDLKSGVLKIARSQEFIFCF